MFEGVPMSNGDNETNVPEELAGGVVSRDDRRGMKRRRLGFTVVAMWLALAAGCATAPPAAERGGETYADALTPCEAPRPEVCTMHYDPVCGTQQGGGRKTYSNACFACSNSDVMGYSEGACADDGGQEMPQ